MSERIILVGASCRAAAESAARSGFRAWCIDQFGDEDLRECAEHVEVVSLWPDGILDVIPKIPPGTLIFAGALENAPQVLARLRDRLPFAGCDVDAMRALRDPLNLKSFVQQWSAEQPRSANLLLGNTDLLNPNNLFGAKNVDLSGTWTSPTAHASRTHLDGVWTCLLYTSDAADEE